MTYKELQKTRLSIAMWVSVYVIFTAIPFYYGEFSQPKRSIISPVSAHEVLPTPTVTPTPTPSVKDVDRFVGFYVDRYAKNPSQQSLYRARIHCLLNKESKHDYDKGHGDNGIAGGPLQFHESTWLRMRQQMLKEELIKDIGSRYNLEQAIETTVWAFTKGYQKEWGPVLRGECL